MDFYNVPPLYGADNWQCSMADFLTGVQACEAPKLSPEQATLKLIQGYSPFAYKFFGEDPVVMRYPAAQGALADRRDPRDPLRASLHRGGPAAEGRRRGQGRQGCRAGDRL